MGDLPLGIQAFISAIGAIALAFLWASVRAGSQGGEGADAKKAPKRQVLIDLTDQPTKIMSTHEAHSPQPDPTETQSRPAVNLQLRRRRALTVLGAVSIITALAYWMGSPWTRSQCLMDASKRHTSAGVRAAVMACDELFGRP